MPVQLARRLINVEEFHRMAETGILTEKDHVELIHGEIIEISPIGSRHSSTVNRISNILKEVLGKNAIISVQNPVVIDDHNQPQPDISILKPSHNYYADRHPGPRDILLVIEVADTTRDYDREIKLPLYASAKIPEFWLVNLEKDEIEVHRLPVQNAYKNIEPCRGSDQIELGLFHSKISTKELLG